MNEKLKRAWALGHKVLHTLALLDVPLKSRLSRAIANDGPHFMDAVGELDKQFAVREAEIRELLPEENWGDGILELDNQAVDELAEKIFELVGVIDVELMS